MRPLFVLALLALVGCASTPAPLPDAPPPGLALTADATRYAAGDEARLTLTNGSETTFQMGVIGCAVLQIPEEGEWVTSPAGNDRACIALLQTFRPGESETVAIPLDVPAGVYRFAHTLTPEGERTQVVAATEAFEVRL